MSINMTMDPVWDAIAGNWTFDHVLGVKSVEWYYRFAADSLYTATAWAPIPRDADENQSGGNVRVDYSIPLTLLRDSHIMISINLLINLCVILSAKRLGGLPLRTARFLVYLHQDSNQI